MKRIAIIILSVVTIIAVSVSCQKINDINEEPETPENSTIPEGALPGIFSVSETRKVYFSKGNLQATYIVSTSSYSWDFAEYQWLFVGDKIMYEYDTYTYNGDYDNQVRAINGNVGLDKIGSNRDGAVVDLFGWTEAGRFDDGMRQYGINRSKSYRDYGLSFTDVCCDWGATIDDKHTWRILTGGEDGEWNYLINKRKVKGETGYGKTCVLATINEHDFGNGRLVRDIDTYGLIIFPDDYTGDTENLTYIPDGCVFLPAAGQRSGTEIDHCGTQGRYWSSSTVFPYQGESQDRVHAMKFNESGVDAIRLFERFYGSSVRLVSDVK